MPGWPVLTGIESTTNGVRLTWDGPPGYYQVHQRPGLDASWLPQGRPNTARTSILPTASANAIFRLSGPSPRYAGAQVCLGCHEEVHQTVLNTRHAHAWQSLKDQGQHRNPSCLPCHTVGYGLPTGFSNEVVTPNLRGVQCESCHGPAANHAANENDPILKPRVEIAATVCGGCHSAESNRPHFEQWSASAHAQVTLDMNPADRIDRCGRCHSGSSRLALLRGESPALAVANDANVSLSCTVCHDPHNTTPFSAQLRNPIASTNDFFLTTSANFATAYNPDINICAQCHNHRGASWQDGSRPPHHSPQYNILLGTVGIPPTGVTLPQPAGHALRIEKQCVGCHLQHQSTSASTNSAMSSHAFTVTSYDSCLQCHPIPEGLIDLTAGAVTNRILTLTGALNSWATSRAPAEIQKYGELAWEYDSPGNLSNPTALASLHGPHADADPAKDEQRFVPDAIKKARFNLYLVHYDGSRGVHNGPYAISLLEAALAWVQQSNP
jgi:hypothetical protein